MIIAYDIQKNSVSEDKHIVGLSGYTSYNRLIEIFRKSEEINEDETIKKFVCDKNGIAFEIGKKF